MKIVEKFGIKLVTCAILRAVMLLLILILGISLMYLCTIIYSKNKTKACTCGDKSIYYNIMYLTKLIKLILT